MSFFDELKRRNVFRVGIAYLVASWLIIQITDVMLGNITAPDWVFETIMMVLGIGFPVVLLFAWAFEMTPEGIKREHEVDRTISITPQTGKKLDKVIILVMGLALVYFVYDKFLARDTNTAPDTRQSAQAEQASGAQEEQLKSIAVLPLANRSAREEDQYFTDGIHDDLLTQLAKIADLKVVSRTSVMRYRDTEMPIPEIAEQLGVKTILEGGIQRSGNQVRINMQLIDATSDEHLWAETYDRQMTAENLFAIQSEITTSITTALKATLTPEEEARILEQPTENLEAYQEFMKGQQLLALRTVDGIEQSKIHFERALELDPGFNQARVGLANALHLAFEYIGAPREESLDPAMDLLNEALETAPQLGEAYMVRGELYRHFGEQALSQADFEKALELLPGNATIYHWYSFLKNEQGLEDEGFELIKQAHQLDPMSRVIHVNVAVQPFYAGRDEEALAELERVSLLHPDYPAAISLQSFIHSNHGDVVAALRSNLRLLEVDPRNTRAGYHCFNYFDLNAFEATKKCISDYDGPRSTRRVFMEVLLLLMDGDTDAANTLLDLTKDAEGDPNFRAYAYLAARNYDSARPAYEERHPTWFEDESPLEVTAWEVGSAVDVALILSQAGETGRANELLQVTLSTLESLERNRGADAFGFADVSAFAVLGQTDKALAALEEAVEAEYLTWWQGLKYMPHFDSIRNDPRFSSAIRQLSAAADAAQKRAIEEGLL